MIFSFFPFHFPFIEIWSRILREQAYLFIYAFSTLLIKEMGFSASPARSSLCGGEAVGNQQGSHNLKQQYDSSSSSHL